MSVIEEKSTKKFSALSIYLWQKKKNGLNKKQMSELSRGAVSSFKLACKLIIENLKAKKH